MSYGKVHDVFWDDGNRISGVSDRAALLALFLMTGRHRNAIGCFRLGIGAITDEPRFKAWGIEGVSEALLELSEAGFTTRDNNTGWTFIEKALSLDPIKGVKAAIHAAKLALAVPSNSIVYQALKEKLEPQLEAEKKGLANTDGWPMREASYAPLDTPSKPIRSPEPYPEPEPQPDPEPSSEANASGAGAPQPVEKSPTADRTGQQVIHTPIGEVRKLEPPAKPLPMPPQRDPDAQLDEQPLFLATIPKKPDGSSDYGKAVFRQGLAFVRRSTAKSDGQARALLGQWRKLTGNDDRVIWDLLVQAERDSAAHLESWMAARLKPRGSAPADDGLGPVTRAMLAESNARKAGAA